MRRARVKVEGSAFYHVMSRCALQQFLLTDEVKEMFLKILRRAECFSGVKIVNYCIMDNHFHILLKVPERREVSDDELDEKIKVLYGPVKATKIFGRWEVLRNLGSTAAIEKERNAFRKRMYDLSEFMKTFKQRFSLWYCTNHGNLEGTIWQGPFHSVLVEGKNDALGAISTYITLNPVRANLVKRPEDYAWSSYGAASTGDSEARSGLLSTYGTNAALAAKWEAYKAMIEAAVSKVVPGSELKKSGSDDVATKADPIGKGKSAMPKMKDTTMRRRERDLSRGVAFGSKAFVLSVIMNASNTGDVRTFPKAFCLGARNTPLYCAGRRRA